ncbi:hypothetical protein Tco_0558736 [Tanacetum coccineum]
MVQMVPYEAFTCRCGAGDIVLRESYKPNTHGKLYYACPRSKPRENTFGCKFFLWKEERVRLLVGSPGASTTPIYSPSSSSTPIYSPGSSTPPRYSPGASTPQTYSPGTSRNEHNSDVEEDQRTSNEFMVDLNAEYHERALLANQKRFYKRYGRDCPSHKTSTPSYPSSNNSFNKSKPYTPSFNQTSSQNSGNHQKDYKGKYKGLKAEMAVLTKRIGDMTKGKSKKGKKKKEKSKKGLIAESLDWDDECVSSDDEWSTKIRAFMAIAEDEILVGKADARSGQWVNITMKKTCSKVTLDQLLSEQVPRNIVKALGGKGRRKEKISSKEVVFTKADESSSVLTPEITSDSESECVSQEPLPPFPKLIGAAPSGTSESLISLSDLTLNMANLTLDTPVPKKTRPSIKVSPAYVIKKKTEKSPAVSKPCSNKKADSSIEQILLTLMEEPKCSTCGSTNHLAKEHLEHVAVKKTLSKLKAQSPLKPSPKMAPMIPKPFKECKYCRFNDHHSNHCEFYPGCEDYLKRSVWYLDSGCSRYMTWIKQYLHIYLKELGPKVVFGDDSSGDTEGEPFTTKMMKLSSLLPEEEMSMSLICHLSIKKAMPVSLPKPSQVLIGSSIRDCLTSTSRI